MCSIPHTLTIRDLTLGDGNPKICIPIVAEDDAALCAALSDAAGAACDLVEYRADLNRELMAAAGRSVKEDAAEGICKRKYAAAPEAAESADSERNAVNANTDDRRTRTAREPSDLHDLLRACLAPIRAAFPDKPLLFTVRTKQEGGAGELSDAAYERLLQEAASLILGDTRAVDLVDVELFTAGGRAASLTADLQRRGAKVIGSSHDFAGTPAKEEMLRRLLAMQAAGMDISKLAVMPKTRADVLALLDVTCQMQDGLADRPFVTMSMGELGLISRLSGGFTGSAFTFASAGKASAPGQIEAGRVRIIFDALVR